VNIPVFNSSVRPRKGATFSKSSRKFCSLFAGLFEAVFGIKTRIASSFTVQAKGFFRVERLKFVRDPKLRRVHPEDVMGAPD